MYPYVVLTFETLIILTVPKNNLDNRALLGNFFLLSGFKKIINLKDNCEGEMSPENFDLFRS